MPEFVRTEDLFKPKQSEPALDSKDVWRRSGYILIGLAVFLGLVIAGWYAWHLIHRSSYHNRLAAITADYPAGTGLDAARVLPQIFVTVMTGTGAHAWFDADRYRQRVEAFAQNFNDVIVVRTQEEALRFSSSQPTYQLQFSFGVLEDAMRGVLQITDANDGRLLDAKEIVLDEAMVRMYRPGSLAQTPNDLNAVRLAIESYGLIYTDIVKLSSIDGPLACFGKVYAFQANPTQSGHLAARQCLEDTIRQHPQLIQAYSLLGGIYISEYLNNLNSMPGDPLELADAALKKAVRLLPNSSLAYQYMQYLILIRGDPEAAIKAGEKSVRLNPESMAAIGNYACILSFLGRYEDAAALLLRAETDLVSPPQWLHFHTFLSLNNLGRYEEADYHAEHLTGASIPLFLSAVAIAAHRAGNEAAAQQAIQSMIGRAPAWRTNPLGELKRYGFSDGAAEKLLRDLVTAGLSLRDEPN
ncbi:MAG: hypothetical protein R3D43_01555 [Tepidamorphaceae bacterium]